MQIPEPANEVYIRINLAITVKDLYAKCAARMDGVGTVRVEGISHRIHTFSSRAIDRHRDAIVRCLRMVNPALLRSRTDRPLPWVRARLGTDGEPWGELERVEQLVAMGIAIGVVTLVPVQNSAVDCMPSIVIENVRFARNERMERNRHRLGKWK